MEEVGGGIVRSIRDKGEYPEKEVGDRSVTSLTVSQR